MPMAPNDTMFYSQSSFTDSSTIESKSKTKKNERYQKGKDRSTYLQQRRRLRCLTQAIKDIVLTWNGKGILDMNKV